MIIGNGFVADAKAEPLDQIQTDSVEVTSAPFGQPDEIQVLLAEVRASTERLRRASDNGSVGGAGEDLAGSTHNMLIQLETLPERIADAVTNAVASQHETIMRDIHSALDEFKLWLGS